MSDFKRHNGDNSRNRGEDRRGSDRRKSFGDRGRRFDSNEYQERSNRKDFGNRGRNWDSPSEQRHDTRGRTNSEERGRFERRREFESDRPRRFSDNRANAGRRNWNDQRSFDGESRRFGGRYGNNGQDHGNWGSRDSNRRGDSERRFPDRSDRRGEFRSHRFNSDPTSGGRQNRGNRWEERGERGQRDINRNEHNSRHSFERRDYTRRDRDYDPRYHKYARRSDPGEERRKQYAPASKEQGRFTRSDNNRYADRNFNSRRFNHDGERDLGRVGRNWEYTQSGQNGYAQREQRHQIDERDAEAAKVEQTYAQFDEEFASDGSRFEGLVIPDGVKADELGEPGYSALATLGERNQNRVAKLLVMAGQLLDLDPDQAYLYAQAAVKHAGRVDVVREAAALTAYATGRYAEALREVRAVRRMRGDDSLRAVEADCERGLDRPEKALEIVAETEISSLSLPEQVELVLVAAGARSDMGEFDTALVLVDDALHRIEKTGEDELKRRLMIAKVEHLRALGRDAVAAEVEQAIPAEEEDNDIVDVQLFADADIDDRRSDLKGQNQALSEIYDSLILDLDGVCYMGANPIENAATGITSAIEAGMNHVFVTNNSSRTPSEVAQKLTELGIPADPNQVMTSAQDLAAVMADEIDAGAKVLVIGGNGLREAMETAGYRVVDSAEDHPDAVVQGFDRSVNWENLSEAAFAINAGAAYYATNLDASLPVERGFALGNGALVRAVRYSTGKKPVAAGKPLPGIFHRALDKIGGGKAICVGDRLETDIACGLNAQMPSMHVLTGVHDAKAVILADRGLRPQLVHRDLRGLNEPHPRPQHHQDGTWTCGVSQVAKVIDGQLSLDGVILEDEVTVTLDSYRALIAAAWDHATFNSKVICPTIKVVDNDDPEGIIKQPQTESPTETEQAMQVCHTGELDQTNAPEQTDDLAEVEDLAATEKEITPQDQDKNEETAEVGNHTLTDAPAEPDDHSHGEADELDLIELAVATAQTPTGTPNTMQTTSGDGTTNNHPEDHAAEVPEFLPGEDDLAALLEETKDLENQ